ncbi:MAG: ATP-dependent DNA ligase [Balneolaceae bacterium]
MTFNNLCTTIQQIRETRGSNAKVAICTSYFQSLNSDDNLQLASQFIGEGAFANVTGKRASVGSRTSGLAAADFCEIDYDLVFKPCRTATGSSSETIEKLMDATPVAREKRISKNLTLQEVHEIFEKLFAVSSRADKQVILMGAWSKMEPVEIKYFIRMMGQGSLRIGFETRSVISAIAKAFNQEVETVRYAHMITGSIGFTAVLAKQNRLDEATFKLFQPLAFMLASPIESRAVDNLNEYLAEEKFDGMRCQVHIEGNDIKLFSRDLNDITKSFPDVVSFFELKSIPPIVLDGEVCVYKDQTILPFQFLQKRMGLKNPSKKILQKYPVLFIAYDMLYADGVPIFDWPLTKRRKALKKLSELHQIPITSQFDVHDFEHLDELFNLALAHGNEGLMLKKKDSVYEYGQRRKSWLKVKKPGGTLDTVMMYAHAGSGKRGGTYSDFTLGVSVKDDERYEEEFIPIGKAYGGYTDEELTRMNKKIKELTVEKYGPTLGLLPGLVIELEFDDIQVNKRTKAGYTLRFPRFKTIRWDLSPTDTNTLKDVEKLFQEKINQDRLSQDRNPSFLYESG